MVGRHELSHDTNADTSTSQKLEPPMGAKKNKLQRFLLKHPHCCFCGGGTPATTIDHIPARTCFRGRAFPETFEFPACEPCNRASRLDEIAFAFYVKLLDHTDKNFDPRDADKTISSMINNLPHLLPEPSVDGRRNRTMLRRMGQTKPLNRLASSLPMVSISAEAHETLRRYARKIACALYYREQGRPASLEHKTVSIWGQAVDRSFAQDVDGFFSLPFLQVGTRSNLDFGDQFMYRHVEALKPDLFAMMAKFGTGLVICAIIVAPDIAERMQRDVTESGVMVQEPWIAVRDNYGAI